MSREATDITELFERIAGGDYEARDQLITLLYVELHEMAHRLLRRKGPNHSLQTTQLVHEVYLKLVKGEVFEPGRSYFFGAAARAMRQIVSEYFRKRKPRPPMPHDVADESESQDPCLQWSTAHEKALAELERHDPQLARVVDLRYFAGLTVKKVAELPEVGTATVERRWRTARAFLRSKIEEYLENDEFSAFDEGVCRF